MKHFLFLHIPKAGGTTLRRVLQRQFRDEAIYMIGDDINGDIQRFMNFTPAESKPFALVMGHMRFGLHQAFDADENICYLSMLREPVARVVSEFRFLQSNPHHSLHSLVSQMSLDEYLESGVSDQISNGQVRLLSGAETVLPDGSTKNREMTEQDLQAALDNIEQYFPQIGFIERYDASLLKWKQLFNWRMPFYIKENVTRAASQTEGQKNGQEHDQEKGQEKGQENGLAADKAAPISKAQLVSISELNALDIQLYQKCLQSFDQQTSMRGLRFKLSLKLYQFLNKLYQRYVQFRS